MDYLAAHSAAQLHASFYDFSSSHISDNMSSPDHSAAHFLRMEDLQTPSASPPPSQLSLAHCTSSQQMHSSPAPVIVHSKAAKKRKSWGQELPQPKTNLPPRKRAKTDDEKEQRRIERIKRNRAAAHNSRERKRQEAEGLAVALAHANAELEAYRRLHGPLPADIVLPEVTVVTESADTPVPSLSDSRSSVDETGTAPSSPTDSLWHHTIIKQEPTDSLSTISLPPSFDSLDAKPSLLSLNPTQHSAVSIQCEQPQPQHPAFRMGGQQVVGHTFSLPAHATHAELLSDAPAGALDYNAFAHGAFDASFSSQLFSFDDYIHDSATVAVDAQAFGAV